MSNPIVEHILKERYYWKGENSWEDVVNRVVNHVVKAEKEEERELWKKQFKDILMKKWFIPNSPTLMNAGKEKGGCLSACFVLPIGDSMEEIYTALKNQALTQQWGGGTGFDFSSLRSKGEKVNTTEGLASGVVSFLKLFSFSSDVVQQGGARRGANMGILRYDHPEILDFIHAKDKGDTLYNFNLSVSTDEHFWNAVKNDDVIDLIDPHSKKAKKKIKARELLDEMVRHAWDTGDPGMVFLDNANKDNPFVPIKGLMTATNPCVTGDTLVSVADGRGAVPIKQLAKENKDVPVYCLDDDGNLTISIMRRPRLNKVNIPLLKITLDDGSSIKVTYDHKFYIYNNDGSIGLKSAEDLQGGDSLVVKPKFLTKKSQNTYYWHTKSHCFGDGAEHYEIFKLFNGKPPIGYHVHHRDFNSLNNSIENLELVEAKEHLRMHKLGDRNPMRIWSKTATPEEKKAYGKKMSKAVSGLKNGRAYKIDTAKIKEIMKGWIEENKIPLTHKLWTKYAKQKHLPIASQYRNINELIIEANIEMGISSPHIESDKILKSQWVKFLKLHQNGEKNIIYSLTDGKIYYRKICPNCGKIFYVRSSKKDQKYCSRDCTVKYIDNTEKLKEYTEKKRKLTQEEKKKQINCLFNKIKEYIYKNRIVPTFKEVRKIIKQYNWMDIRSLGFKNSNILFSKLFESFGLEYSSYFRKKERKKFAEKLIDKGLTYNHKVVKVEKIGSGNVYTGTVDKYHNFGIVIGDFNLDELKAKTPKLKYSKVLQIFSPQCGEEVLYPFGSCNLGSIAIYNIYKVTKLF